MNLDLVRRWLDLGVGEEGGDLGLGEVGEADGFGETSFVELLEGAPCRLWVGGEIFLDNVLWWG